MFFGDATIAFCRRQGQQFFLSRAIGSNFFCAAFASRPCSRLAQQGEVPTISPCTDNHAQQLALLLSKCGNDKTLPHGRLLHIHLIKENLDGHGMYGNRLVRMYGKCGAHNDARALFDRMQQRDSHSWRFMIGAYATCGTVNDALQLFQQMMMEGFLPMKVTMISILSACVGATGLVQGRRIHTCIMGSEFESDVEVGNTIINMYSKCHSLPDALCFFSDMPLHNVVSFNTMITAFVQHEESQEALELFQKMKLQAIPPNNVTFISVVSACVAFARLSQGKEMHACVLYSEFAFEVALGNALLNMYGKCGSLEDAKKLFWKMPSHEVVTWNCMITSLIQHEQDEEALQFFHHMQIIGTWPNNVTFANILSVCAGQKALAEGSRLHLCVVGTKSESDVVLGTALVNMYSKCGSLEDACRIFEKMSCWDVILWNAMIEMYVKHGKTREAINLFEEMQSKGLIPTKVTFINLLDAFPDLAEGKQMHAIISRYGFEMDLVVGTGLMNMYNRCCSLDDVHMVFDKMPEHDLVSWNALLAANARHGLGKETLFSFQMMLLEGVVPDKISFISICDACGSHAVLKEGMWMHAIIVGIRLETDFHVRNSVINMYGKCGNVKHARRVFQDTNEWDEVSWNAMIAAYAQAGQSVDAFQVFRQMQVEGFMPGRFTFVNLLSGFVNAEALIEGKRVHATMVRGDFEVDVVVVNTLMNMYGKFGKLEDARLLFDMINKQDIVTWNGMLAAYAQREKGLEALLLFQKMLLECVIPDRVTFISVVSACASQATLAEGKQMHARVLRNEFRRDVNLGNALINMYGKCGSVEDASAVFENMHERDVVSWNATITAYAFHGHGQEALQLYYKMQQEGVVPNKVTYLIILSACSHAGLLEEGLDCIVSMIQDHGIRPDEDHYNCIIDLLGRAGLLDEGEGIINSLLSQPTAIAWSTLLGFCRMHCDAERGERAARRALHLEPKNSALYVLLSNIYASSRDDASKYGLNKEDLKMKLEPHSQMKWSRSSVKLSGIDMELLNPS